MMVEYKIIKYCRACKKRYVVMRGESRKNYCDECYARMQAEQEKADKENSEQKK